MTGTMRCSYFQNVIPGLDAPLTGIHTNLALKRYRFPPARE
jgi:hypothetical protein